MHAPANLPAFPLSLSLTRKGGGNVQRFIRPRGLFYSRRLTLAQGISVRGSHIEMLGT